MVLLSDTGGGGGAGGTFGSPTSGNLPGTSPSKTSKGSNSNPLSLTGMDQNQLNQGVMGGIGSNTILPTDPVHLGTRDQGYLYGKGLGVALPQGYTYQQAQTLPGTWMTSDPKYYKQFLNKLILYKYPGASSDMGLPEAMSAWDDLLKVSITLNKAGGGKGKQWSPWDILDSYNHKPGSMGTHRSGDWLIDNATNEKIKYVGPKSKTTKQSAIDLSDPEQVQVIATEALTRMIGRAPNDKELAQFKATLNGYEKEHPEVTTTTEHYDDMGNVTASNVVHSGGVDDATRATLLGKGVQKTKEYGKYQSGTTYFNALMQMIGGG